MTKKEYIGHLARKGYHVAYDGTVSLGPLRFQICSEQRKTAMGMQNRFYLKLMLGGMSS